MKERIEQSLSELIKTNKIIVKGDFIWTLPEPANIVRNRQGLDYVFDPDQICTEEYEQAISLILQAYGTRIRDRVVQDVARLLGFARAGQKITLRVSDIIQKLIDTGKITNAATGLMLVKTELETNAVLLNSEAEMIDTTPTN